jgi:hypothetical protein
LKICKSTANSQINVAIEYHVAKGKAPLKLLTLLLFLLLGQALMRSRFGYLMGPECHDAINGVAVLGHYLVEFDRLLKAG